MRIPAASGAIFFLEVTWAITLFVQLCVRNDKLNRRRGLKGPQGTIVESKPRQDNTEKKQRKASRQLPTRSEVCPSFPRVSRRTDEETRTTGKHLDKALRCKGRSLYKNEDSFCSRCWSNVLKTTRGWRRALLYLPLSCVLAWRPNKLWLSYVAAGLLAVLSLLHIASSALGRRDPCQSNAGTDSVGESLLNSRQDNYDRFEEVLVTEVLDDCVSGSGRCPGDSDGEI
ncbi:uncharacterized protein LOC115233577 isoform X2 [Formica exsecta]|uniref:uncharacterized protein LOC115233577 isoform X2 n=1 Tax=Formica exsecta TaxID=72781 RepID=UPI0011435685|nr:uncharacterized protein LOC115233577 isoform X2 [Formica exsecta]